MVVFIQGALQRGQIDMEKGMKARNIKLFKKMRYFLYFFEYKHSFVIDTSLLSVI